MEPKPSGNIFAAVHMRIAAKKKKMRADQFTATGLRQKDAQQEANENGFDRPAIKLPSTDDKNKIMQ
jgi:hypothetical protein